MGHAITLSVRRRRAELATVRALGFTARQTRTTIVVLAVTVGAIASLIAVPIGVSAGATVWRLVAEGAAVLGDARVPILPLLLAVPVTVVLAVGLAARPARRAGRQPVVATLRSE
jgi:ABC-type lipoprotein release transport system permease subunit